jgi:hypothetical protein
MEEYLKRPESDTNRSAVVNKVFRCLNLVRFPRYLVNVLIAESLMKSSA